MKLMRTLGLLLVLIALSGYVYFYEIKGGEERTKQKEIDEKIFNFESDNVEVVEIRSLFNQFRFERRDDAWTIMNPVETGGDRSAIDGLLTGMKNVKKIREFSIGSGEQPDYGLVGRSSLVIFQFKDGTRDSVRFGDPTPVGENVFAGRGDTTVFIVPASVKQGAEKSLFDWRDKSIARIEQSNVREMRLKNNQGSFYFIKENAKWMLKEPREVKADEAAVNKIIGKFQNDKIKSVVSEQIDDPARFRLDRPGYVVDLYLGEGKAHKRLMFSALKDNVANGNDDSRPYVFTVDSTFTRDLNKTFFDLRDKSIAAAFNRDLVDSLIVEQGDSTVVMSKDSSKTWWLGGDKKIKSWKINSLFSGISGLKAVKFLEENVSSTRNYGLREPVRILRLFQTGEQIMEIHFSDRERGKKVAFCPDSQIVAEISDTAFDSFEVKTSDYIETESEQK